MDTTSSHGDAGAVSRSSCHHRETPRRKVSLQCRPRKTRAEITQSGQAHEYSKRVNTSNRRRGRIESACVTVSQPISGSSTNATAGRAGTGRISGCHLDLDKGGM